ncbi:hypothetical protein WA158_002261 [Blastocystis sp. Blastoise]
MAKKTSEKAKLKKELRKQLQEEQLRKQNIVNEATARVDILDGLTPLTKFTINNESYEVKFFTRDSIPSDVLDTVFDLTKTNMKSSYEACDWGWKDGQKWSEFVDNTARFLVLYNNDKIAGFVHFRFMVDEGFEVIYIYEIQIDKSYQSRGLGAKLIRLIEFIGMKNHMQFSALTCFKHNPKAYRFYTIKMGYVIDAQSPSKFDIDECYEILSKCIDPHLVPPTR